MPAAYPGKLQNYLLGNTPAKVRLRIADQVPLQPYNLGAFHEASWPGYVRGDWEMIESDLTPNGWATITGQALVGCNLPSPAQLAFAAYLVAEEIPSPALLGVLLLADSIDQLVKAPGVWYMLTFVVYQDTPGFE